MELNVLAQIITGMATLIVAMVLVFQLRKQNEQLAIQHKDQLGNAVNQFKTRFEDITKETVTNSDLADIWIRGSKDWNNLKSDVERYRFRNHYRQYFNYVIDQIRLRNEGVLPVSDELIKTQARNMVHAKGLAHCYKNYHKKSLMEFPEIMKIWDDFYLELYDEDISDFVPKRYGRTNF